MGTVNVIYGMIKQS